MPDNDIFRRYVARSWRRSTRCFHSDTDPTELAPMLLRGATRCLKTSGGLPALPALIDYFSNYLDRRLTGAEVLNALRTLQREGYHNRNVQLGTRVLERLLATHAGEEVPVSQRGKIVAEAFLRELIDHNVLDPSIPEIENLQRFATLADRYERADQCRTAIVADGRLERLAAAFLADPSCTRLRLPAVRAERVPTVRLLTVTVG